ncbi:hypothetical protein [Stenotrophomonas sp. GD03657]|uniref:hypothetical protein n=1 Tax=Stenotrophomonas sp. GD03657 TaxID=2975363 RepID=UPI00244B06F1|nr:hypothetical protein [Stenotrophomonas sp. GD03657]MDH2154254.1 hypothetical protein [Stenotrophomonas sp. GD03657]
MYTQASQRIQEPKSLVRRLFDFLVPKLISGHGKRAMFITSLYFELSPVKGGGLRDPDRDKDILRLHDGALERLNAVMDVAKSATALRFPAVFRSLVWRDCNVRDIVSTEDFQKGIVTENVTSIAEKLVDAMPPGLRYETRPKMVGEVVKLLRNGPGLARAA